MFSCKRWTSTKFVRSDLTTETLASPKHPNFLALSRSDLWMVWRWHGTPRVCYYFCLKPTVRKETWMRTISVTVMVISFLKCRSKSYLITAMKKYEAHWQQHFQGHPTVLRTWYPTVLFYRHGSTCVLNLSSRLW